MEQGSLLPYVVLSNVNTISQTLSDVISRTVLVFSIVIILSYVALILVSMYYDRVDKREKQKENALILLSEILDIYRRFLDKEGFFRYGQLKETFYLDKTKQKLLPARKVFILLLKMKSLTKDEKEKFLPIIDKYEVTFEIIRNQIKIADSLDLLRNVDIHDKNLEILKEPFSEMERLQHKELEKIKQELADEVELLSKLRNRQKRSEDMRDLVLQDVEDLIN